MNVAAITEALPGALDLRMVSRNPARLPDATIAAVRGLPVVATPQQSAPHASIVIVVRDNLVFTRMCLLSVLCNTDSPSCEIIVVDNGSTDGTAEMLREFASKNPIRVITNAENRGFAAANNQGLRAAKGDVLVLLNNDTIVTPAWLERLITHLADKGVGAVGPVTNRIGNAAEIDVNYSTYGEMTAVALRQAESHRGRSFELSMPAMFCLAMRRDAFEKVGLLDERFGVGMFEDDDYALRMHAGGFRTVCAQDVFVHHFGQASFGQLMGDGEYGRLFALNRQRFEDKWKRPWQPHQRQRSDAYRDVVRRINVLVGGLPADSRVLVISKGDDALLAGRAYVGHFPQDAAGVYAGYNPKDSWAAIGMLEALRSEGAEFLVIPATAFWWLEHYADFRRHLEMHCKLLRKEEACMIVDLRKAAEAKR